MPKREQFEGDLEVHQGREGEVYKDIVRIHEGSRGNLKAGRVHKFSTCHGTAYFILRGGDAGQNVGKILMDDVSRTTMGLTLNSRYKFDIREAGFWGELWWACNAVDPTYRIAARLGVLSFGLGIVAVVPIAWQALGCAWKMLRAVCAG